MNAHQSDIGSRDGSCLVNLALFDHLGRGVDVNVEHGLDGLEEETTGDGNDDPGGANDPNVPE